MLNTICHLQKSQPNQGKSAYWSMFAFMNSDRTPEISRVQEGDGYA